MINTHKQPTPVCPHCGHDFTTDEMTDVHDVDLFAIAHLEDTDVIQCPHCDKDFWVKGGYTPHYTSAFAEELL